jgi:hypothetical protein
LTANTPHHPNPGQIIPDKEQSLQSSLVGSMLETNGRTAETDQTKPTKPTTTTMTMTMMDNAELAYLIFT